MPEPSVELELLRARLATVEQLLEEQEKRVVDQSVRLDEAMSQLRTRVSEAEQAQYEAEQSAARMRFLSEAGVTLSSSLDYETTLRSVAFLAVPRMADWCVVDVVDEGRELKRVAVAHEDPEKVALVHDMRRRYPDDPDASVGIYHVVRTGEPELVPEIPDGLLRSVARDDDHLRLLRSLQLHSYLIVPLYARGVTLGALTLVTSASKRSYTRQDLEMAQELAARAAIAIDNARLVRELENTQRHLEHTASELEAQTDELQTTVEELELTTQDLLDANEAMGKAKQEAEHARAAAEEANAAKSHFLATMSHELRTPLNAIDGYAELLQLGILGELTEKQVDAIHRIRRAQKRLLSLINDVLNFARLEAGQVSYDLKDVPVLALLAGLEPLVAPQVSARQLHLAIDPVPPELVVHADQEKAEQILLNLVANAVKFTPSGGSIRISASADDTRVYISVADTGQGIPAHRLESIFEPFVQGGDHAREQGGVGLGLAISRDLARSMNGDLICESNFGVGSRFTVSLPLVGSGRSVPS